ncbi:hypothetical protein K502DRAFT_346160 [Neoconidiobolus thromboides FSU 785]|nr:hypothetical protein K502DRAFT_346160 [Neoconidiobolus thromboides FSU 785]
MSPYLESTLLHLKKNEADPNNPKKVYIILHDGFYAQVVIYKFPSVDRKTSYKRKSEDEGVTKVNVKAETLNDEELVLDLYFIREKKPTAKVPRGLPRGLKRKMNDDIVISNAFKEAKDSRALEVKDGKVGLVTNFNLNFNLKEIVDHNAYFNFDKKKCSDLGENICEFTKEKLRKHEANTRGFKVAFYLFPQLINIIFGALFSLNLLNASMPISSLSIINKKTLNSKLSSCENFETWSKDALERKNIFKITGVIGTVDIISFITLSKESMSVINYITFDKNELNYDNPKNIYTILYGGFDTELAIQNFNSVDRKVNYKRKPEDKETIKDELDLVYSPRDELLELKIVCEVKELYFNNKKRDIESEGLKHGKW